MSEKRVLIGYVAAFVIAAGLAALTGFPAWIEVVNSVLILLPVVVFDAVNFWRRRSRSQ